MSKNLFKKCNNPIRINWFKLQDFITYYNKKLKTFNLEQEKQLCLD